MSMIAPEISEEEYQRLPEGIPEECMSLCRPGQYNGRRDIEALEVFIVSLEAHLRLHSGTEETIVIHTCHLLEGDAQHWWLELCRKAPLPLGITSV